MQHFISKSTQTATTTDRWAWLCSAVGALLGLLLGIALFAPASWLYPVIREWSEGHLLIEDTEGSIWNGSARLVLSGGTGSRDTTRVPGRVHWDVTLHAGSVELQLRADCCTEVAQEVHVVPLQHGWSAKYMPSESTWPAALLAGLGPPWNSIQLDGTLHLISRGLQVTSHSSHITLAGEMTLLANAMRSRLSGPLPVGSYRLILQGGAQPALQLDTVEGELQMSGQGYWDGSQLQMQVQAQSNTKDRPELIDLLRLIAQNHGALFLVLSS